MVKSLELTGSGPVGLVHTQKIEAQSEKPTWTKALKFTQFACPCGTDPRLLSGEQRTSHFKLVTSVDDPERTWRLGSKREFHLASRLQFLWKQTMIDELMQRSWDLLFPRQTYH